MASPSKNMPADINAEWLALRQKHQDESNNFQRAVARGRAEFDDRAERARKNLLAKHLQEERNFWNKNDEARKGASSTAKAGQAQTLGLTKSNGKTPARTSSSAGSSLPPPRLTKATNPDPRRTQSKLVSEVINLCSDDEEDSPPTKGLPAMRQAPTINAMPQESIVKEPVAQKSAASEQMRKSASVIPEATMQFFGDRTANCSSGAYVKDEEQQLHSSRHPSSVATPFMQPTNELPSYQISRSSSSFSQLGSIPTPIRSSRPLAPPATPGHGFKNTSGQQFAFQGSTHRAGDTWPNSMPPSMSNGYATNSADTGPNVGDVDMRDASAVDEDASLSQAALSRLCDKLCEELVNSMADKLEARSKRSASTATTSSHLINMQSTRSPSIAPAQPTREEHLPSPPPSHASAVSEPMTPHQHGASAPAPAFKRPSVPASATSINTSHQGVAPDPRYIRTDTADSHASSITLPVTPDGQRRATTTSQSSHPSPRPNLLQNRKRKVELHLSSDEEDDQVSDYAPSERDSPLAGKSTRQAKDDPAAKKSKAVTGIAIAQRVEKVSGKNGYGFKYSLASKPKPAAHLGPPSGKKSNKATASTPRSPGDESATLSKSTAKTNLKVSAAVKHLPKTKYVPQPGKRRAAMRAENKIQDIFEDEEDFITKSAIEDADQLEAARLPEDLRRMSITPAPRSVASQDSFTNFEDEETMEMEAENSTAPKGYGYGSWTQDRVSGDRHVSKKPRSRYQATVEDADSELDVSKHTSLQGPCVRRSKEAESDLTNGNQTRTS